MISNYSLHYIKPKKLIAKKSNLAFKNKDVVIEVKSCGMCGTDLKIFKNGSKRVKKNRVMGHEIAGKIVIAPKNQKYFNKNYNIVLGADIETEQNKDFALGHEIDGGSQKYLKINSDLLKKIPHFLTRKKINYDVASLTEPLACCLNGLQAINFKKNKNILIFGAGSIGQLISKLCIFYKSKKVFLVDKKTLKLKNSFRHKKLIKLGISKFRNKIKDKIDYIFVACSSPEAQKNAVEYSDYGTTINFFAGLPKNNGLDPLSKINTNAIHYKQLRIVGSHGSKKEHVEKAAKLIINKKLNLKKLISKIYKIKDYNIAFKKLATGKLTKIVIKP